MVLCPYCKQQIDHLDSVSYEAVCQDVTLDTSMKNMEILDYGDSESVVGSCTKMEFCCPLCGKILYTNNGASDDEKVKRFFKTGDFGERKTFVFR